MTRTARIVLAALGLAAPASTFAIQTPPPTPPRPPAASTTRQAPAPAPAPADPRLAEKVATVNGEPITKGDLIDVLGEFQVPPGSEERAYQSALDLAINTKLLQGFLKKANANVAPEQIDDVVQQYRKDLETQGGSLEQALADTNTSLAEFRGRIERSLQWEQFVTRSAKDDVLRTYIERNLDLFRGTQVRASHILLKVPDGASEAEKAAVRDRLESIRKEVEGKAISFADAANKYSEDDGNVAAKNGGDLGYFPRKGQFIEEFAAAAFALKDKVGAISPPVETEYGLHLIQVTGVRPGQDVTATDILADEQMKGAVLNQYATELQSQIVESERAKAKIESGPMPADLFRLIPPEPATPSTPAGTANPPATSPTGAEKPAVPGQPGSPD